MAEDIETTVSQSLTIGQMATATVIRTKPTHETATGVQSVRTVTTTKTTGDVSIRYIPRPIPSGGDLDTIS